MQIRPRLIYFDTNAASSTIEPRQGRTREHLTQICVALEQNRILERIEPVLSCTFFEEYAPTFSNDLGEYKARLQTLRRIFRHNILWPVDELIQREAQVGRLLRMNERFLGRSDSAAIWNAVAHPAALKDIIPIILDGKAKYLERTLRQGNRARADFVNAAKGSGASKQRLERAFASGVYSWGRTSLLSEVERWAMDTLEALIERGWLPQSAAQLPTASIPSLRNGAAYTMALMVMNLSGQSGVLPSDGHDVRHFAEAHYCDLMVSDDSNFIRTAGLLDDHLEIISFDELGDRLRNWLIGPVVTLAPLNQPGGVGPT